MGFLPKKVPLNWYSYDVRFSIQLMFEYVQGIEQQIANSIVDFKRQTQIRTAEQSNEDQATAMKVYGLLDDETWDLPTVFEGYFPNLQRRSALITVYSFFEHELNQLCNLFVEVENLKISLNDISGRGIQRPFLFLQKVVGLPINHQSGLWNEIKQIQELRNRIVHQDGQLRPGNDPLRAYVDSEGGLSGDTEVLIWQDYLDHVVNSFDLQFQELNALIEARARGGNHDSDRTQIGIR